MGTENGMEHRNHHSSSHRHHTHGGEHHSTVEHNRKIRRKKLFQNLKRIVFIIIAVGVICGVIYYLANPDAKIDLGVFHSDADTERIEELEREVERLNTELEQYRSGQISAPAAQ